MGETYRKFELINQRLERLVQVLANYQDADMKKMLAYVMNGDEEYNAVLSAENGDIGQKS